MHRAYPYGHPRDIIKKLMVSRGFASGRGLALAAGVQQPTLARYLKGTSDTMEMETFAALADALGVTVSELIGETPLSDGGRMKQLLALVEKLPEPQQDALIAVGKAMSETGRRRPS
jgi:transcriptional regulator with XRE-family HTH domain